MDNNFYINAKSLPRETRGEDAKGATCPHGRALQGEGCPACGAEAGELIDPQLVIDVTQLVIDGRTP